MKTLNRNSVHSSNAFHFALQATVKALFILALFALAGNEAMAVGYPPYGGHNIADADSRARADANARASASASTKVGVSTQVGIETNVDVAGDTINVAGDTNTTNLDVAGDTNTLTGGTQSQSLSTNQSITGAQQTVNVEGDTHLNFTMGQNQYEKLGDFTQSLTTVNLHAVGNEDDYYIGAGMSFALGGTSNDTIHDMYKQQMFDNRATQHIVQCKSLVEAGISFESAFKAKGEYGEQLANHVAFCNGFEFTETAVAMQQAKLSLLTAQVAELEARKNNLDEKSHTTHLKRHAVQRENDKVCKNKKVSRKTCHTITASHYGEAE